MIQSRVLSKVIMIMMFPAVLLLAQTPQKASIEGSGEFKDRLAILYGESAKGFVPSYQAFLQCLKEGNKEGMAELIRFPVHTCLNGKKVNIPDKKTFIANYEEIFYPRYTQKIMDSSKSMFVSGQGVAIGEGLIWFAWYSKPSNNWRIKAINNYGY
jgi:hypothetical protein